MKLALYQKMNMLPWEPPDPLDYFAGLAPSPSEHA